MKNITVTISGAKGTYKTRISEELGPILQKFGYGLYFYADNMSEKALAECIKNAKESYVIIRTLPTNE